MAHTKELFSLKDKIAIVTGGYGLYGHSISAGLCEMGAHVIIASRNEEKCREYARELCSQGHSAEGMYLDLSKDDSIHSLVDQVMAKHGKIDILVNNAVDRKPMVSLDQSTREKLQASVDTNLNGHILISQAVLKHMIPVRKGSIINISSMRGLDCPHFPFYPEADYPNGQPVTYTAEKWALVGLTKYMAGCYGKYNIRVNCIAPGGYSSLKPGQEGSQFHKVYIEHVPLQRWANDDDIKGPVAFLASDASGYVTGATLVMDGGWTIW